jgi:hypothetical protein
VAIIQIIYFELCLVLSKGIRLLSLIVVWLSFWKAAGRRKEYREEQAAFAESVHEFVDWQEP